MAILTSKGIIGFLARRLLPGILGIPLLLAWLKLQSYKTDFYDTELDVSQVLVLNIVVFLALVWWRTEILYRMEMERRRTDEEIKRTPSELVQAERPALLNHLVAKAADGIREPLTTLLQEAKDLIGDARNKDPHISTSVVKMEEGRRRSINLTKACATSAVLLSLFWDRRI